MGNTTQNQGGKDDMRAPPSGQEAQKKEVQDRSALSDTDRQPRDRSSSGSSQEPDSDV